jgi:predicted aspartyl protease
MMVQRSVEGTTRDLYTFTLVLQETQGAEITLTDLEQTLTQPESYFFGETQHATVHWKLRPHGELRQLFSVYGYCAMGGCRAPGVLAPWYHIVLTGTDAQGHPLRVAIEFKLPWKAPAGPKIELGQAAPSGSTARPAEAQVQTSGPIPFWNVQNQIWLHALLNQKEQVALLLDTGATHTLLTPETAKRLGISPAADAPKRQVWVLGGHQVEIPFVQLATLAVGAAVVSNLQVGLVSSFRQAPLADGMLGEDFLHHFTLTIDYTTSRLSLAPPGSVPALSTITASNQGRLYGPIPLRFVNNHILVPAMLHQSQPVTLVLDTGAAQTLLSLGTAQQLGLNPGTNAPRKTLIRADGQPHTVPLVQCAGIAVGGAAVENLPVGVTESVVPHVPAVAGLLGVDFLERFTVTIDHTTRQLWLMAPLVAKP